MLEGSLHCHHPRKRVIQYSRDDRAQTEKPRRTGSPAGACHRARRRRDPVAGDDNGGCGAFVSIKHTSAIPRPNARVLKNRPPSKNGGSRECRVRAAPAVSCAKCTKESAHEHTGSAEAIRHSLRNGFTAYIALSPATNSSCHRRSRISGSHRPVGLSEPPSA
jgi:hypothetical protein